VDSAPEKSAAILFFVVFILPTETRPFYGHTTVLIGLPGKGKGENSVLKSSNRHEVIHQFFESTTPKRFPLPFWFFWNAGVTSRVSLSKILE
jgi:hypothetical protein